MTQVIAYKISRSLANGIDRARTSIFIVHRDDQQAKHVACHTAKGINRQSHCQMLLCLDLARAVR
jgi:hypothetical protein